jgi:spore maturation protein CgeB
MKDDRLRIVVLGLSITSSWGNGHATTFRSLLRALSARGHDVTFLERDLPWYADNRDLPSPPYCTTHLYSSLDELRDRFSTMVREADVVIVGSYVPDGARVCEWVLRTARGQTAFYDIDTPVTLSKLAAGDEEYLSASAIPRFDLYLSFTGGKTLQTLERRYGSPRARALYCSVDPSLYHPLDCRKRWDLGYLGTYSDDRQPTLSRMLIEPAARWPFRRFVVAGPQYPDSIEWPANVERTMHLPPAEHVEFYNAQRFTLNVTRAAMVRAGHSPSVRLFEAAACGVAVISDPWVGLDELFRPGEDILVAETTEDVLRILRHVSEEEARAIGERARRRVLAEHTSERRAEELERHLRERSRRPGVPLAIAAGE